MKFEIDKRYSTTEFMKQIGVSKATWVNRKEDILSDFSKCYTYEVEYQGRSIIYHILDFLGTEYEYQRKSKGIQLEKTAKRDKVYEIETLKQIYQQPINTAKNVSRATANNPDIKAFNYTEGTHYEYTRIKVRQMFGTGIEEEEGAFDTRMEEGRKGYVAEKIWCKADFNLNAYEPMPEEHVKYFKECLKERFHDLEARIEQETKYYDLYDEGVMTKQEIQDIIIYNRYMTYCDAKGDFHKKYGYYPLKVSKYKIFPEVIKEYNLDFDANY